MQAALLQQWKIKIWRRAINKLTWSIHATLLQPVSNKGVFVLVCRAGGQRGKKLTPCLYWTPGHIWKQSKNKRSKGKPLKETTLGSMSEMLIIILQWHATEEKKSIRNYKLILIKCVILQPGLTTPVQLAVR